MLPLVMSITRRRPAYLTASRKRSLVTGGPTVYRARALRNVPSLALSGHERTVEWSFPPRVNAATFARADAQHVQQLPQLVSAYYDNHEILSTAQDNSAFVVPLVEAGLLSTGLPLVLPILQAPSAEGTRIELTPVSFNSTIPNSEAPIPWYQDYNPSEMFALHSIVEVAHALEYRLNQLMPPSGGTAQ